jgi:hypothetical protein
MESILIDDFESCLYSSGDEDCHNAEFSVMTRE